GPSDNQISMNGGPFQDLGNTSPLGGNHYSLVVAGNFISVPGFALVRVATGGGDVSLGMSVQLGATSIAQNTQRLVSTLLDDQNRVFDEMIRENQSGLARKILNPLLLALGQKKIDEGK